MGSVGNKNQGTAQNAQTANQQSADTREYRSRTNSVDVESVMNGAYFKNAADLYATIASAESHGFDILSRSGTGDFGNILYTWSYGNEGDAYEIYYERSYANPANPSEIQVKRFRHLQEGEW